MNNPYVKLLATAGVFLGIAYLSRNIEVTDKYIWGHNDPTKDYLI